ncbi:aldose 1-epimerase family protein [Mycetocola sp. JXN-3]|uniref:aldose 1-epimerase family protein n=1 Tax=Mycetocola sp. JXN-3 TaxID=2116510 RepID=UPI00165CF478|nr:aldose 1-epimerase family protein [Mycetocola sp. JXN-3]
MHAAPNGQSFTLTHEHGDLALSAEITEVAAGLRVLTANGVDVLAPYDVTEPRPMASGIVLAPWPNRVEDARWVLDGQVQQLDVTEPAQSNAIHGLLRFTPYTVLEQTANSIRLAATVFPQHGYPFHLDTEVDYVLDERGLTVTHRLTNRSEAPAPAGVGAHPYLTIGGVPASDLTLTVACDTVWEVNAHQIPQNEVPVGAGNDLRQGVALNSVVLDHGFAAPHIVDGVSSHTLADPAGRTVTIWGEERFGTWQVFNPTRYPGDNAVVAIEPMTAPANALNSGIGLEWIAPGETWSVSWGIRAEGFTA